MLIVLDTNVLVSGLINPFGAPARVLDQITLTTIRVAFDDRIFDEYREVLNRATFGFSPTNVRALIDHIILNGMPVVPEPLTGYLAPDPGDLPFAEVAINAHAKCLVAGNLKHFGFLERRNIPVLTPAEFVEGMRRMLEEGNE